MSISEDSNIMPARHKLSDPAGFEHICSGLDALAITLCGLTLLSCIILIPLGINIKNGVVYSGGDKVKGTRKLVLIVISISHSQEQSRAPLNFSGMQFRWALGPSVYLDEVNIKLCHNFGPPAIPLAGFCLFVWAAIPLLDLQS